MKVKVALSLLVVFILLSPYIYAHYSSIYEPVRDIISHLGDETCVERIHDFESYTKLVASRKAIKTFSAQQWSAELIRRSMPDEQDMSYGDDERGVHGRKLIDIVLRHCLAVGDEKSAKCLLGKKCFVLPKKGIVWGYDMSAEKRIFKILASDLEERKAIIRRLLSSSLYPRNYLKAVLDFLADVSLFNRDDKGRNGASYAAMSGDEVKVKWSNDESRRVSVREMARGAISRFFTKDRFGKFVSRPRMTEVKPAETDVTEVGAAITASTLVELVSTVVGIGGTLIGAAISKGTRLGVSYDIIRNYIEQEMRLFGHEIPVHTGHLAYVMRHCNEIELYYLIHGVNDDLEKGFLCGGRSAVARWDTLMARRFEELLRKRSDDFLSSFSDIHVIPAYPEWRSVLCSTESDDSSEALKKIELGGVWERYGINPHLDGIHIHDLAQKVANQTGNIVFLVEAADLVNMRGEGSANVVADLNRKIPGAILLINRIDKLREVNRGLYERWRALMKKDQRIGIIVTSADEESAVAGDPGFVTASIPQGERMRAALLRAVGRNKREKTGEATLDSYLRFGDFATIEQIAFRGDDISQADRANMLLNLALMCADRALIAYEGDQAVQAARLSCFFLEKIDSRMLTDVPDSFHVEHELAQAKAATFLREQHDLALRLLVGHVVGVASTAIGASREVENLAEAYIYLGRLILSDGIDWRRDFLASFATAKDAAKECFNKAMKFSSFGDIRLFARMELFLLGKEALDLDTATAQLQGIIASTVKDSRLVVTTKQRAMSVLAEMFATRVGSGAGAGAGAGAGGPQSSPIAQLSALCEGGLDDDRSMGNLSFVVAGIHEKMGNLREAARFYSIAFVCGDSRALYALKNLATGEDLTIHNSAEDSLCQHTKNDVTIKKGFALEQAINKWMGFWSHIDSACGLSMQGWLYEQSGENDAAGRSYKNSIKRGDHYDALLWASKRGGRGREDLLRRVVALKPKSGEAFHDLGTLLYQKGNAFHGEARKLLADSLLKGWMMSAYLLGRMYEIGESCTINWPTAFGYFEMVAESTDLSNDIRARAYYHIGRMNKCIVDLGKDQIGKYSYKDALIKAVNFGYERALSACRFLNIDLSKKLSASESLRIALLTPSMDDRRKASPDSIYSIPSSLRPSLKDEIWHFIQGGAGPFNALTAWVDDNMDIAPLFLHPLGGGAIGGFQSPIGVRIMRREADHDVDDGAEYKDGDEGDEECKDGGNE